jgi:hypothetical protein
MENEKIDEEDKMENAVWRVIRQLVICYLVYCGINEFFDWL